MGVYFIRLAIKLLTKIHEKLKIFHFHKKKFKSFKNLCLPPKPPAGLLPGLPGGKPWMLQNFLCKPLIVIMQWCRLNFILELWIVYVYVVDIFGYVLLKQRNENLRSCEISQRFLAKTLLENVLFSAP